MKNYLKNIKDKKFLISIFCYLGLQAIMYLIVKQLQTSEYYFNHRIDGMIPFIPQMIIIYNLFYPAVFIAFYSIYNYDKESYYKGIISGIIGFLITDIVFILYPVYIVRPNLSNLNIDPIHGFIIRLTYKLDNPPSNCFPSIHCLLCFQAIASLIMCKSDNKKFKIIMVILLSLIIISTVLVKQHYFVDIIGALGACIASNYIGILIYDEIDKR